MSTITTKFSPSETVWYIGADFKAKQGVIQQVMTQTIPAEPEPGAPIKPENLGTVLTTNPPKYEGPTKTYVQYQIDGQYMHEERAFRTVEELLAHVHDDPK